MSNYEKLKELAEATKGWDNLKSCWPEETEDGDLEVNWFVGAVTEDDDKYPVLEVNTAQYDALEDAGRLARYYAAANPSAVAALIAENERLSADCSSMRGSLKANAVSIKKLIKDGGRAARERDQLRAEVAGLRTGYEAYERVNAELKAEVEALRKLGPSKEIIWCACGDGYPVNSYGAGFMAANGDVCENCDAANGRVEPHLDTPDELKALRQALTDIFNHVEGNTECLVRDLVNWGTPRINPNDFYDECEAIKEIANAALGQGVKP